VESITEEYYWDEFKPIELDILVALGTSIGGGVDFFLTRNFGFNFDFRYHRVEFHKQLGGLKDYSGPQLTWGFKVAF